MGVFLVVERGTVKTDDDWRKRVERLKYCEVQGVWGNKMQVKISDDEALRMAVGDVCDIKQVG